MKWKRIYEHYDEWDESTIKELLLNVTGMEEATSDEIIDFVTYFSDEETSTEVLKAAIDAGIKLSSDELLNVADSANEETFTYILLRSMLQGTFFQPAQLECLDGYVDEKTMSLAVLNSLKHGVHFKPAEAIALDGLIDERTMEAIILDAVKVGTIFKVNDIERLSGLVGQDVLDKAALSSKGSYSEKDIETLMEYLSIEAQAKIAQHSPPRSQKSEVIQTRPSNAALAFLLTKMLSDKPAKTVQRFQVGDAVYVRPYSSFGRIIDINGNMYMVRYSDGKYVSSFPADELEKTT